MSFKSKDLMIDVFPARNSFAIPGLQMGGAVNQEEGDEEPDCEATRPSGVRGDCEMDLAMLRHQLREALSQPPA